MSESSEDIVVKRHDPFLREKSNFTWSSLVVCKNQTIDVGNKAETA